MLAVLVVVVTVVLLLRAIPRPGGESEDRRLRDEGLPWAVKAYAAAYVVGSLLYSLIAPRSTLGESAVSLLIGVPLFFVLLVLPIIRGSRTGWVIITLLSLLSFIFLPNAESTAVTVITIANGLVSLGLLLHPETQRWCGVRLWGRTPVSDG